MSSTPVTPTVSSVSSSTGTTFSPTATPSQSGDGGNGGPSSSLYLFTFLATLFLLLFVSSAIILRSFILRRRFRRRIEEAILAGVIPAPHTARVSRRRAIGEKPKLWEARVYPAADDRWDAITPVAAQLTAMSGEHGNSTMAGNANSNSHAGERPAAPAPVLAGVPAPLSPLTPHNAPHQRSWLRNLFAWRRYGASSASNNTLPISGPLGDSPGGLQRQNTLPSSSSHERLRVTVLIAMPDPRRPHADGTVYTGQSKGKERSLDLDYDEDDLPEMALGMAELQYKDTITTTKSS